MTMHPPWYMKGFLLTVLSNTVPPATPTNLFFLWYLLVETLVISGIVGLNNIKANDYMNVILHTLAHVGPFRDFFLREENYNSIARLPGDQTFSLGIEHQTDLCIIYSLY